MRTLASDGRPRVADLHEAYDRLEQAGWAKTQVAEQVLASGAVLPICAYTSGPQAGRVVIAGIHGRGSFMQPSRSVLPGSRPRPAC